MADEDHNLSLEATPFERAAPVQRSSLIAFRPVPIAIGIVFLLLALAALFMFTARAVLIVTEPQAGSIRITDGFFNYRLGERYLMLPGEYEFEALLTGYHPLRQRFTVGSEPDQDFSYELRKLPGILAITTAPDVPAEVFVDQVAVGTTPLVLEEIEPGLHDIALVTDRYLTWETEVTIEGRRVEQSVSATLEPAWAEVTLSSSPDGANILVDDKILGVTPATVEVLQGERTLALSKPGYKQWQSALSVEAGIDQALDEVMLVKSDGTVSITTTPAGANVTINERYQGQSPLSVVLPPGQAYQVLLTRAGYEPETRRINVEPEQDVALNVNLDPVVGVIRLRVTPEDSELFVDGKSMGPPVERLTLTASRHTIEVRKPGFATYVTEVTPQPGLSQQLLITLQTEEEAKIASIPQQVRTADGQQLNLILPGAFEMGAGRRERGRRSNEILKEVTLTRAYYLGVHEVTNKQFMAYEPGHDPGFFGRSVLNEEGRPVVNVSWDQAVQYCNFLSRQDNLPPAYEQVDGKWRLIQPVTTGYRLPTEAEWAWAARYADGPATRFPWGQVMPPPAGHGNYADESALNMVPYHIAGYNDNYRGPSPVGTFTANAYGLYDLSGNVSEWMHDLYSVELVREMQTDPLGGETGDYHVIRGSNYTHGRFSELRWTFRDYGQEPRRDVGFRLARYVE